MAIIFIGLGSNEGDRMQILRDVFRDLKKNLGIMLKGSSVYESPAWGFESDQPFLNAVLKFETEHRPAEVLNMLHYLEEKAGRKRSGEGRYADRTLDLDLLYYDDLVTDELSLQIPHPRISQRNFVLIPLAEIEPEWLDMRTQKTVSEMLKDSRDTCKIKQLSERLS